jgi:DDE superfamily endonuclease
MHQFLRTPVLRHHFAWKRLSIAGVLAYEPDGSDAHLVFQLRPGAYNDELLIDFLAEVHRHEQQRSIILIWDGLPSHRSRRMLDWVANQRDWLSIEPLPGYAPDLNPMSRCGATSNPRSWQTSVPTPLARYRKPPKTACTASAATPRFAPRFSATPVCGYDHPQPAIARESLRAGSQHQSVRRPIVIRPPKTAYARPDYFMLPVVATRR